MAVREVASDPAASRIARLVVSELEQAVERDEFGVVLQDVQPLDNMTVLEGLARLRALRNGRLRVALVGAVEAVAEGLSRYPAWAGHLSSEEEVAVGWRNRGLRTIAVVTNRPLAKAASLREFRIIGERELARRLCGEQRDAAEVTWLRTLWDALERGRMLRIPLLSIVRFAHALEGLVSTERSAYAPRHLYMLGLFPDSYLADEKSEQRLVRRLTQNRELVREVARGTDEDWARIRAYCKALSGAARSAANRSLRRLREIAAGATLEGLDFADAQTVWRGKVQGESSSARRVRGAERVEVERVVGRRLLTNDTTALADIGEELRQIVEIAFDDEGRAGSQDVKHASGPGEASVVEVDRPLLDLVRSRSTESEWGGVIEVGAEGPGALTEVAAFKSWMPFCIEPISDDLKRFAAEGIAPSTVVGVLGELQKLRARMLPHAPELAISPVAALAGDPELMAAAEQYLATYEQLLRQVYAAFHEMQAAADFEAERVLGQLLCLELYVYRHEGAVEVVLSPLHPLYLWRSVTLVREVRGLSSVLSEHEMETVELACAEDLQILQVLVLPRQGSGTEAPLMLGQAGRLGRLPTFREAPRGMLEADGARAVGELAQRLSRLRPFVRPGLQVVLVNLPRPARFIEELISRLDLENTGSEDTFWGMHLRVRYTQPDTRGWANEAADLEDGLRELVTAGEERGLLTLSVQGETIGWEALTRELCEHPAHLAVIVDPFEVRSMPVARAQMHALSPWMPTCEYRFNRIRKEVQVIPVAEEHVFGSYLAAASLVQPSLQRKTPVHLPQVRESKDILDELAKWATWTVIADPHRVPLARLGTAEVIDRRIEKGRQLTCFAHDLAPFVRRLDEQLRRTHFLADSDTLQRLVRDLVAMEPNGILGLASSSQEKQVKGSLGKLIAVRWYRSREPSGLAVSLDTENAARWLVAGHHSREKADLLGLREEDGCVVVDVIEVKAHDEAVPYSVVDGQIQGRAVGQVLATLQALAEVFAPDSRSPLSRPRREVLREHLYTALLREQESEYVERWHTLLEDVFAGKVAVRLSGRIVHVQLSSVAHKEAAVYLSASGVPVRVDTLSAEDVGLVLRPSRAVRPEGSVLGRGVDVSERLDPAAVLQRLIHKGAAVVGAGGDGQGAVRQVGWDGGAGSEGAEEGRGAVGNELGGAASREGRQESVLLDIALGTEHASSKEVHWAPGKQSNGFFLVLGASGSGKTEALKVLGSAISEAGIPVLVFDFHGDVIFPGLKSVLLSSGSASTVGINPMELDIHSAEESGLYDQRAALRGMIQRAVPALGHRQSSILREAFDEAYRAAGIVDEEPKSWGRVAPTFGDVQGILAEWAEDDGRKGQRAAVEGCLAAVQELFDHPIFRRSTYVGVEEMLSTSVRLDLSKLPDEVRFVATETLLRKLFRWLRLRGPIPVQPADDRQRFRLFVFIDEAKILSLGGGERDRADNVLNELLTEARKFGLGMVLASQMSDHFSEEVRANAATWLVLKPMDIREAKRNAPNVSVDPEDLIHLAGRGDGYYRDRPSARARRVQVRPLVMG